jgi:menaquinone-dependent protoporphyrinogen oxidase
MRNGSKPSIPGEVSQRPYVPVFYATTEGQTGRIAERIAETLGARGISSEAVEVLSDKAKRTNWNGVEGAILGASIHIGKYQKSALQFARRHREELNRVPSAFFGVSLSAASANPREVYAARRLAEQFPRMAGWNPIRIASIAGALAYTRYGFVKRFFMRLIAKEEGGPTDTSRDHELTDWGMVARFANGMADICLDRELRRVVLAQPEASTPSQLPTA